MEGDPLQRPEPVHSILHQRHAPGHRPQHRERDVVSASAVGSASPAGLRMGHRAGGEAEARTPRQGQLHSWTSALKHSSPPTSPQDPSSEHTVGPSRHRETGEGHLGWPTECG